VRALTPGSDEGCKDKAAESFPKAEKVCELPKQEEGMMVEQLKEELSRERQKAEGYLRQLQYLQADFENYQRRMQKEVSEAGQMGSEALVRSLLNTLDELELAIQAGREAGDKETILKGVEMVYKNLYSILKGYGLSKIEAVGARFDPSMHEAAARVPDDKAAEGTVLEEVRKGFIFKGKVIRPSIVKVAVSPASEGSKKVNES